MATGWLGSIELKFLVRGGFVIGSHQVQTKGRIKGIPPNLVEQLTLELIRL